MRKPIDLSGLGSRMPLSGMRPGIQGGVSTANLQEALLKKGLSSANLATALGNAPAAAPSAQNGGGTAPSPSNAPASSNAKSDKS